jgi:hypothetical protein
MCLELEGSLVFKSERPKVPLSEQEEYYGKENRKK